VCAVLSARFSVAANADKVKAEKFVTSASNNSSENNISCVFKVNCLNKSFMSDKETVIFLQEINSLLWTMIWFNAELLFLLTLKAYACRLRISASAVTAVLWKKVFIKSDSSVKRLQSICLFLFCKYCCVQCSRVSNCAQYINAE